MNDALVYLSEEYFISHCNLKPQNILVSDEGDFILTDLAILIAEIQESQATPSKFLSNKNFEVSYFFF